MKYDKLKAQRTGGSTSEVISSENGGDKPSSNKDLVIGMAKDLDSKNFAVFVKSLRAVSKASIVIFINEPIPERHQSIASAFKIDLVPFDSGNMNFPVDMKAFHPSTVRWPLIYRFLSERSSSYSRIWLIDVRDSYFQADPFGFISPSESTLHVFQGVVRHSSLIHPPLFNHCIVSNRNH